MGDDSSERKRPNILVTGTPGVGKTSTASLIAVRVVMKNNCTEWSNAQTSLLIFSDAMLFCRNALD
jgi:broad-specificity NMP kinase